jgi:hypothetical protein
VSKGNATRTANLAEKRGHKTNLKLSVINAH